MATRPPATTPPAGRVGWLDAARGLAISLVVLLHANAWLEVGGRQSAFWDDTNELLTSLRMPLFFTVSGLLATTWVVSASWRSLLGRKVLVLVWAYALWQPIGSLAAVVASRFTGDELTPLRMLVSLAATPVRPRFELWFLWALAICFVLARLLARVPVPVQLAGAAVVAAVAFSSAVPADLNLGWSGVPRYLLFFLLGARCRSTVFSLAGRLTPLPIVLLTLGWTVLAVPAYATGWIDLPGVGLVVRVAGMAAGLGIAVLMSQWRLLRELGSRTLPLYLAHTPVIVVLVWALHGRSGGAWPDAAAVLAPVVVAVLAAALSLGLHGLVRHGPGRLLYEPPVRLANLIAVAGARLRGRHVAHPDAATPAPGLLPVPAISDVPVTGDRVSA